MNGIINLYKEKGGTSHDCVSAVRRLLGTRRVGHAGTLDPDAEGVLIILVGKATKLSDYLMAGSKEYRAKAKFGAATSTYDASGEVISEGVVSFTQEQLKNAVSEFVGEQEQMPPMYSAIKINGRKLYDLARKGIDVERKARKIVIDDIYVEEYNGFDEAVIYIKCKKGTYVRSVCHDLGVKLGCWAHMTELTRTRSGGFGAEDAVRLDDLRTANENGTLMNVMLPIEKVLECYNAITVPARAEKLLYNGAKIGSDMLKNGAKIDVLNVLYNERDKVIGIYEAIGEKNGPVVLKPKTMLWSGEDE